jgi:transcriptional regulator GlxA family with amidase domain
LPAAQTAWFALFDLLGGVVAAMKGFTAVGTTATKSIGILGFDGLTVLDLAGPLEALTAARTDADEERVRACYDVSIIGVSAKTVVSESGVILTVKDTLLKAHDLDTIIIPGGVGIRSGETSRKVAEWLAKHAPTFNRVVSVCTGIYPLAQSGLLDGRKVATHWRFAQDVARRFPRVSVDPTASFIKDGPFYTCGGGTAAIELTLALIEEDYGSRVALSVAREFGMRLRPLGDNKSSIDPSQFDCGPADRLAELPAWISAHLDYNLSGEVLAERACLCYRHFTRLFRRLFKSTPGNFVEALRIGEARRCLLLSHHSVESVALAVGFKNPDSFRRAFERRVGLSPAVFRRMGHKSKVAAPAIPSYSNRKTNSSEKETARFTALGNKLTTKRRLPPISPRNACVASSSTG